MNNWKLISWKLISWQIIWFFRSWEIKLTGDFHRMRLTDGLQFEFIEAVFHEKRDSAKRSTDRIPWWGNSDFLSLCALGGKNHIFSSVPFYFSFTATLLASCRTTHVYRQAYCYGQPKNPLKEKSKIKTLKVFVRWLLK